MTLRGLHLHIDCPSGAAGDMMLGALLDLGVPADVIGTALDAIGAGRARLLISRVVKSGLAAVDVKVDTTGPLAGVTAHSHSHSHDHSHSHSHDRHHSHDHHHSEDHAPAHPHYHYAALRRRIDGAALPEGTKRIALDIFDRIARAEAKLHGTTVDDVAFHEVGAIDSVVDVVGTAAALDWLAPTRVTCASVAMGHGTVRCAHGILPVPAPAALEVLREANAIMADGGIARELCTPTGAAILAATVTSWTPAPTGRPTAIGWGAGDADLADRPNVLRVLALAPTALAPTALSDDVWQIDANIDDMSPELCTPAADALFTAGALDVWWSPITMKKGRPALLLSALATENTRPAVITAILRNTTTIGVRYSPRQRTVLARRTVLVETRYGAIPIKVAEDAATLLNAAPEYEACAAAAAHHNVPVKLVFAAALAAFAHAHPD
jgi:pyridinium-3,5-bisthiocarboxylic acid mononucleotide nickel chelatase